MSTLKGCRYVYGIVKAAAVLGLILSCMGASGYTRSMGWTTSFYSYESGLRFASGSLSAAILDEIGISCLLEDAGLRGQGITVALVDTGVDVGALATKTVVDWFDVTSEGRVTASSPIEANADGVVEFEGVKFRTQGLSSKSGRYRVGVFAVEVPADAPAYDVFKNVPGMRFVVVDSYFPGQYDTVYMDSNGDGWFSDEQPLEVYRGSRHFASVPTADGGACNFVVADILDNGSAVVFGFDANGHGTAAAGILAGSRLGIAPVCPDAAIIAVKAVTSAGESSWLLVEKGIETACECGADVVIVGASPGADSHNVGISLDKLVSQYADTLFVLAVGNGGPGIGTLPTYGGSDNLLVVGGYVPSVVAREVGWGEHAFFYPWSSCGPDAEGRVPSLLAPAIAPTILPGWAGERHTPVLVDGTSVAAVYTGGAAVLIRGSLGAGQQESPACRVKQALEQTAIPLAHLSVSEQGNGVLKADRAAGLAPRIRGTSKTRFVFEWMGAFHEDFFFDRDRVPGLVPIYVDNLRPAPLDLQVELPEWVSMPYNKLGVPPVDQRAASLAFHASEPGLYSGFITADDASSPGTDLSGVVTAIVPESLHEGSTGSGSLLGPGELFRKFLRVPDGVGSLSVEMTITARERGHRGRACLYVYDGKGKCVYSGPWNGSGADTSKDSCVFEFPAGGVWEIVVVCDPQLRLYKQEDTAFYVTCEASGVSLVGGPSHFRSGADASVSDCVLGVVNRDDAFEAYVQLLVDGHCGVLKKGESPLLPGVSATIAIPRVEKGIDRLCIVVWGPQQRSHRLEVYLYALDAFSNQWKEATSVHVAAGEVGQIVIQDPLPGQYVAYVDSTDSSPERRSFKWLVLETKSGDEVTAVDARSGLSSFAWGKDEARSIGCAIPTAIAQAGAPVYLAVWNASEDTLKNVVALPGYRGDSDLVVSILQGGIGLDRCNATLRAWNRDTMRPVSACIEIDGTWYQLHRGGASVVLERTDFTTAAVRAEYPGMKPWVSGANE